MPIGIPLGCIKISDYRYREVMDRFGYRYHMPLLGSSSSCNRPSGNETRPNRLPRAPIPAIALSKFRASFSPVTRVVAVSYVLAG